MKVWVYESRRGEVRIFDETKRSFARVEQDADNGCNVDDARTLGLDICGDPEHGNFSIDDGGSITLMEVE